MIGFIHCSHLSGREVSHHWQLFAMNTRCKCKGRLTLHVHTIALACGNIAALQLQSILFLLRCGPVLPSGVAGHMLTKQQSLIDPPHMIPLL